MRIRNVLKSLIILTIIGFVSEFYASAQATSDYPVRPIQLLVGSAPGGSEDVRARAVAPKLGEVLGQPVVVVQKLGAANAVALGIAAKSKPDGYTFVSMSGSPLLMPYMQKLEYNFTDFTHICGSAIQPLGIVVRSDAVWETMRELIDYIKNNPGKIKYGSWGVAGRGHIFMELLGKAAGLNWTHVPFKGDAPCITALLGGHIQVAILASTFVPHAKAGRLKLMAALTEKRIMAFPQVPTLKELGFNIDFRTNEILGYSGPKGLPPKVLMKLENAFKQAVESDEFQRAMEQLANEKSYRNSQEFTKLIHESIPQMWEMIKQAGILQPGK